MNRLQTAAYTLGTSALWTLVLFISPLDTQAACTLVPTAGDDNYICDSGSSPGLTDTGGNNSLTFPQSGTGSINGDLLFGPGADLLHLSSGTISGSVDMGHGANILQLFNGAINGAIRMGDGNDITQLSGTSTASIDQGAGNDTFSMSGGSARSVDQGDGTDTFTMSGGTITDLFENGEQALMSEGTIGRVQMNLDNNTFEMLGGKIFNDLDAGINNNSVTIRGGLIGGNIIVSGTDNNITVTGGEINGQVRGGTGDDIFTWDTSGLIHGGVLMGTGNDRALLHSLTEGGLASAPIIDGGLGNDTLTFDNTQSASPGRYPHWETVNLDNDSHFDLSGDFVLGDNVSATGTFNVNGSSVLQVDQGRITPFTNGQLATLNNKGVIDLTGGTSSPNNQLTVVGNYSGDNGQLRLNSVLASDDSPSDKLVVDRGSLSGSTVLSVTNVGGLGDETRQNGILVVQALNGATASDNAFVFRGPISVGAYDYHLFKGGVTAGTTNNWYLRSSVQAPPPFPGPEDPPVDLPHPVTPLPAPEIPVGVLPTDPDLPTTPDPTDPDLPGGAILPTQPDLPVAEPGKPPIPLYRQEVPVYSALLPAVNQLTRAALGTFHERQGDQSQQRQAGALAAGWGRVYASNSRQSFAGTVNPRLDGSLSGYQVGSDLFGWSLDSGLDSKIGFFVGHSRSQGDIDGFTSGFQHRDAGKTTLRGNSAGLYWTLIDPYGGYLDSVLMWTDLDINSQSNRGIKLNTQGHAWTASVEAGYPFAVSERWVLEPQAQLIGEQRSLDSQNDGIADVSFDADNSVTARLGARLRGSYKVSGMPLQPYVRSNVWHTLSGTDRVTFNHHTDIDTEQKSTTLELSMGTTLQVSNSLSLYGEAGYDTQLDSNALNGRKATLGVRLDF